MFKTLKSLLAGLIAGTAIGVLFAPKKGQEIRKNLKKEVATGGTGFSTVKGTLTDMGKEIGDSCKETYSTLSKNERVQKGAHTAAQGLKKAYDKVRSKLK